MGRRVSLKSSGIVVICCVVAGLIRASREPRRKHKFKAELCQRGLRMGVYVSVDCAARVRSAAVERWSGCQGRCGRAKALRGAKRA